MKRSFIITLALAAAALLVAEMAAADGEVARLFSANTTFKEIAGILPGGGVTCIGGEPNQKAPWPLCTPGTVTTRIRGVVLRNQGTSADAPMTGTRTTVLNANLDKDGRGPMWGTGRLEVNEPGLGSRWGCSPLALTCAFEGVYTGTMLGYGLPFEFDAVLYGVQGAVEGMRVVVHGVGDVAWNETMNGYYYPPAKK